MAEIVRYAVWGSAGHAKVLAAMIGELGGRVAVLFDRNPQAKPSVPGATLYSGPGSLEAWLVNTPDAGTYRGLVAIGGTRGRDRADIAAALRAAGLAMPPLVHPRAFVCPTVKIGVGSQILALACAAADARIGEDCILNHRASIDHECVLGEGVHIAPGATLCGCVVVERFAFVGAGAVVLPRLRIGVGALIGAGAVVTSDVPPGAVVAGNPARLIR